MLDGRGNDVVTFVPIGKGGTLNGVIVGFAAAAGKHHLFRYAMQQIRHLAAGLVNGISCLSAVPMRTGRIAEMLEKIGAHGLGNFRVNWGSGVVIQVNWLQ